DASLKLSSRQVETVGAGLGLAVGVGDSVAVAERVVVAVAGGGVGHGRQSHKALLTLAIRGAMLTGPAPSAGQRSSGTIPSAMVTARTKSLMPTWPRERQSPMHTCAGAGRAMQSSSQQASSARRPRTSQRTLIASALIVETAAARRWMLCMQRAR